MKTKTHNNQKVSDARSKKAWVKKLILGRLATQSNPSKLRLKRIHLPKTQRAVATSLKLSFSSYCNIERGGRTVDHDTAVKICEEVGSSIQYLFAKEPKSDRYRAIHK